MDTGRDRNDPRPPATRLLTTSRFYPATQPKTELLPSMFLLCGAGHGHPYQQPPQILLASPTLSPAHLLSHACGNLTPILKVKDYILIP